MADEKKIFNKKLNRLYDKEDWQGVVDLASKAPESYWEAHYCTVIGHSYRKLENIPQCIAWCEKAVVMEPLNMFCVNILLLGYGLAGKHQAILDVWEEKCQQWPAPGDEADLINLSNILVNVIYAFTSTNQINTAIETLTPWIKKWDHPSVWFNVACLNALHGDEEKCEKYIEKVLLNGSPKEKFEDSDFDGMRKTSWYQYLFLRDFEREIEVRKKHPDGAILPEHFVDFKRETEIPSPSFENKNLIQLLRSSPDKISNFMVMSDWLQVQGDPRGKWIAHENLMRQCKNRHQQILLQYEWADTLSKYRSNLIGYWAEVTQSSEYNIQLRWYYGYIQKMVFDTGYERGGLKLTFETEAAELLLTMLRHQSYYLLRELTIRDVWCEEELYYDDIIKMLKENADLLPVLQRLTIRPAEFQISWTHITLDDIFYSRFPQLQNFMIGAGNIELNQINFPNLESFTLQTGGLTTENMESILSAHWPKLQSLEIWFGDKDYGASVDIDQLEPIFEGHNLSNLKKLCLMNATFTDQIVTKLATSKILPQIEFLDLSKGCMTQAVLTTLIAHKEAFINLKSFIVAENSLDQAAVETLKSLFPFIVIGEQKNPDNELYVSVGE